MRDRKPGSHLFTYLLPFDVLRALSEVETARLFCPAKAGLERAIPQGRGDVHLGKLTFCH